jgi:hypothetical protein
MADVVDGAGDVQPTVEQESRSFELPAATDPTDAPAPAVTEESETQPPAADDSGSSSSDDEAESKRAEESTPASESHDSAASAVPAAAAGRWNQLLDRVHPSVKRHADTVANHPVVNTLRQRAVQAHQTVVNNPYVQKGTGAIKASGAKTMEGGKMVRDDPKRFVSFFAAIVGLMALGLLFRVLAQKYPEYNVVKAACAQIMKLGKGHKEL